MNIKIKNAIKILEQFDNVLEKIFGRSWLDCYARIFKLSSIEYQYIYIHFSNLYSEGYRNANI